MCTGHNSHLLVLSTRLSGLYMAGAITDHSIVAAEDRAVAGMAASLAGKDGKGLVPL